MSQKYLCIAKAPNSRGKSAILGTLAIFEMTSIMIDDKYGYIIEKGEFQIYIKDLGNIVWQGCQKGLT